MPEATSKNTARKPQYLDLSAGTRTVTVTLDDGPHKTHTDTVLGALKTHGVKAVFFLYGDNLGKNASVMDRIVKAGHRVGNHTMSHTDLTTLTPKQIEAEIIGCERLIGSALGDDKLFRPPFGAHNAKVDKVVSDLGYRLILWNVDTKDWDKANQPTKWMEIGIDQIRKRTTSLVLAHDIHKSTANNFGNFLQRIKDIGKVTFGDPADV